MATIRKEYVAGVNYCSGSDFDFDHDSPSHSIELLISGAIRDYPTLYLLLITTLYGQF